MTARQAIAGKEGGVVRVVKRRDGTLWGDGVKLRKIGMVDTFIPGEQGSPTPYGVSANDEIGADPPCHLQCPHDRLPDSAPSPGDHRDLSRQVPVREQTGRVRAALGRHRRSTPTSRGVACRTKPRASYHAITS
jgi:hypothetical protein